MLELLPKFFYIYGRSYLKFFCWCAALHVFCRQEVLRKIFLESAAKLHYIDRIEDCVIVTEVPLCPISHHERKTEMSARWAQSLIETRKKFALLLIYLTNDHHLLVKNGPCHVDIILSFILFISSLFFFHRYWFTSGYVSRSDPKIVQPPATTDNPAAGNSADDAICDNDVLHDINKHHQPRDILKSHRPRHNTEHNKQNNSRGSHKVEKIPGSPLPADKDGSCESRGREGIDVISDEIVNSLSHKGSVKSSEPNVEIDNERLGCLPDPTPPNTDPNRTGYHRTKIESASTAGEYLQKWSFQRLVKLLCPRNHTGLNVVN